MKTNDQLIDQISEMKGKEFMYRGRNVVVRGYEFSGTEIEIKTDTHSVHTSERMLKETLDEFLPVSEEMDEADRKDLQVAVNGAFEANTSKLTQLEDILLSNIRKIEADASYVDQAKEINNQANSIIKIAKTKVDMVREMRKIKES